MREMIIIKGIKIQSNDREHRGRERAKGGGIKRWLVELMKRSDQEGPRRQES